MDEELARIVAVAAMRSSHELGDLIPILKEHCPADVYAELSRGIAASLAEIGAKVLTPVFAAHPLLEREFDRNVERYGRTS